MPKEKLNKFMKERSGAAVTQKEADRLKALQEAKEIKKGIDQRKKESLSGAAISEAERERLKKVSRAATTGAAAEAMSADAMKNISGAGISDAERDRLKKVSRSGVAGSVGEAMGASVTDAERDRLKDAMPDYADGGEVVFGKGKDYIKDLL